jgi:hypothetical protein
MDGLEPDCAMSDVEHELLAGMRAQVLVGAALARLGRPRADLERGPAGRPLAADEYRRALGTELSAGSEPGVAADSPYAGSRVYRFRTTLWPGFDLLVREHPSGFMYEPELVRAAGEPVPDIYSIKDLVPWTVLDSEVRDSLGPHLEETRWEHGVDALRDGGLVLAFDYGLLQEVRLSRAPSLPRV